MTAIAHHPGRIVLTMALDPTLDPALNDGARRCLILLRSLAGHARKLASLTSSLATQLGRCVNTVRNYRDALVAAGYIEWQTDPRSGVSTIYIREAVEPPSRRAQLQAERESEAARHAALEHRVAQAVLERAGAGFAAPGCMTPAAAVASSTVPSAARTWHLPPAPSQAWRGRPSPAAGPWQGGAQLGAAIKTSTSSTREPRPVGDSGAIQEMDQEGVGGSRRSRLEAVLTSLGAALRGA